MINLNVGSWIAVYFVDVYHLNLGFTAGYYIIVLIFALLGRSVYPVLIKYLKNEYRISGLCFLCSALCSSLLVFIHLPAAVSMVVFGLISALTAIINAHFLSIFPAEITDTKHLSFVASFMDVLTYGGAGIGSLVFGFLIPRLSFASMFAIWALTSFV